MNFYWGKYLTNCFSSKWVYKKYLFIGRSYLTVKALATILACSSLLTLMYFRKLSSVVCPVIAIILMDGTLLRYINVANVLRAVWFIIYSYLGLVLVMLLPPTTFVSVTSSLIPAISAHFLIWRSVLDLSTLLGNSPLYFSSHYCPIKVS